eukprot:gene14067-18870_t
MFFMFILIGQCVSSIVRFGANMDATTEEESNSLKSVVHTEIRSKIIKLPSERPNLNVGELIEFELFDGEVVFAKASHVFRRFEHSAGWFGKIMFVYDESDGPDDGYFELSCEYEACVAVISIYSTKKIYRIDAGGYSLNERGGGIYKLTENFLSPDRRSGILNRTTLDVFEADVLRTSPNNFNLRSSLTDKDLTVAGVDIDLILDLLVIYTPQALSDAGSLATLKSMINLANDGANVILSNSA